MDDEDWEKISKFKWFLDRKYLEKKGHYKIQASVYEAGKQRTILLNRTIMNLQTGDRRVVDHISGDTLDNRKQNLRVCSIKENSWNARTPKNNKSGYKGVFLEKKNNRYRAFLSVSWGRKSLGYYDTLEEAARAYDKGALYCYGEYARTNFPREHYSDDDIKLAETYLKALEHNFKNRSSKYRGVHGHDRSWQVGISNGKDRLHLGTYKDEEEAAKVYDRKAIELKGDKAILNFPKENYIKECNNEQETAE